METPIRTPQTDEIASNVYAFAQMISYEDRYPSGLKMPAHAHQKAGLYFVLEGAITEVCRKREYEITAPTLVFHPAGEIHANTFHNGGRVFGIELEPLWLDRLREYAPTLDRPGYFQAGLLLELAVRLYAEFQSRDLLTPLVMEALTLEMLAEAARSSLQEQAALPPRWLQQARNLLHDRSAFPLSLHEIASTVGVHRTHLSRAFRQYYHLSIGEYVRRLRLEQACAMLRSSDLPLAEVAMALGYYDQSHFTTAFKRHTGFTPAAFRNIYRRC